MRFPCPTKNISQSAGSYLQCHFTEKMFLDFESVDYDKSDTPRKINMEAENIPLEKENHLPNHNFQVLC